MKLRHQTILLISPEPWGPNHVSKHHYARTLAERGNKVYFLNPPSHTQGIEEVQPNLWVVDYRPRFRGLNRLPAAIGNLFIKQEATNLLSLLGQTPDIVWSFDPYRWQNLKIFGNKFAIFHPVDIHHNNRLTNRTADKADLVLASSQQILNSLNTRTPTFKINHGLAAHFAQYKFTYPQAQKPVKVGYVGNLHYQYIDKPVLKQIIGEHPEVEFHFIGPYRDSNLSISTANADLIDFLQQQVNCELHGPVPSEDLPELLDHFHLFLMCYSGDRNRAALANPHKLLEYLATGRVVVSHYIDEYQDKRYLLEMTDSNKELPGRFAEVLRNLESHNRTEKQAARQQWARKNTYPAQIDRIEKKIVSSIINT